VRPRTPVHIAQHAIARMSAAAAGKPWEDEGSREGKSEPTEDASKCCEHLVGIELMPTEPVPRPLTRARKQVTGGLPR